MVQKIFLAAQGREKFFGPLVTGSGGMLPQKILKISVLRLAESAFPTFWTHQFVVKMLRSSSNRGNWCCLTIKLFEVTADLEILVMYYEGGRISCIPGDLAVLFILKSFLAEFIHFFLHFFAK